MNIICGCRYLSVVHLEVKSRPGVAFPPGQVSPGQVSPGQVPQGQEVWGVCSMHGGQVYICQPTPGIDLGCTAIAQVVAHLKLRCHYCNNHAGVMDRDTHYLPDLH